jgi:hypothetical protein
MKLKLRVSHDVVGDVMYAGREGESGVNGYCFCRFRAGV